MNVNNLKANKGYYNLDKDSINQQPQKLNCFGLESEQRTPKILEDLKIGIRYEYNSEKKSGEFSINVNEEETTKYPSIKKGDKLVLINKKIINGGKDLLKIDDKDHLIFKRGDMIININKKEYNNPIKQFKLQTIHTSDGSNSYQFKVREECPMYPTVKKNFKIILINGKPIKDMRAMDKLEDGSELTFEDGESNIFNSTKIQIKYHFHFNPSYQKISREDFFKIYSIKEQLQAQLSTKQRIILSDDGTEKYYQILNVHTNTFQTLLIDKVSRGQPSEYKKIGDGLEADIYKKSNHSLLMRYQYRTNFHTSFNQKDWMENVDKLHKLINLTFKYPCLGVNLNIPYCIHPYKSVQNFIDGYTLDKKNLIVEFIQKSDSLGLEQAKEKYKLLKDEYANRMNNLKDYGICIVDDHGQNIMFDKNAHKFVRIDIFTNIKVNDI
ncbi:MAG TPA: hypothetical protein PKD00_04660 [Burkholderiales bacterium]|nr:hypothetical protein [Burkholderiales bacterium]